MHAVNTSLYAPARRPASHGITHCLRPTALLVLVEGWERGITLNSKASNYQELKICSLGLTQSLATGLVQADTGGHGHIETT